jgi:protein-L-isoaspartate(D-aspartate) O-methyltransferase
MTNFQRARNNMVSQQLSNRGVTDQRVLQAMSVIPREAFVPEGLRERAYYDSPLDIGFNQTISQPFMVAKMAEELAISDSDRILEIGTGCGYQTAILASLADSVYTIEIVPDLAKQAQKNLQILESRKSLTHIFEKVALRRFAVKKISFRCGDGRNGWPEAAPFDGIIVSAAAPGEAPPELISQMAIGAKMLIPLGQDNQKLHRLERTTQNVIQSQELIDVRFVPLVES